MSLEESSKEFEDNIVKRLSYYTVGLLKEEKQSDGRSLNPSGSGVLVEVRGVKGIVTAGHVARELQKTPHFALFTLESRFGKAPALEISTTDLPIVFEYQEGNRNAPDIGFLQLPRETEGQLIAKGNVFYNFEVRLEDAISSGTRADLEREILCGVIAENSTNKSKSVSGRTDVHEMTFGYGTTRGLREMDANLDVFDFEIVHSGRANRPISYEGLSGSAVWKVGNSLEAKDRLVYGIAIRQSDAAAEGARTITCHGPMTLYRYLPDLLARAFPDQIKT